MAVASVKIALNISSISSLILHACSTATVSSKMVLADCTWMFVFCISLLNGVVTENMSDKAKSVTMNSVLHNASFKDLALDADLPSSHSTRTFILLTVTSYVCLEVTGSQKNFWCSVDMRTASYHCEFINAY
jgi:hypothetical protein